MKLIKESLRPSIEDMAFTISQIVYTLFNGDDVDYESSEKDQQEVENALYDCCPDFVNFGWEQFEEPEVIIDNFEEYEIRKIYDTLEKLGYI